MLLEGFLGFFSDLPLPLLHAPPRLLSSTSLLPPDLQDIRSSRLNYFLSTNKDADIIGGKERHPEAGYSDTEVVMSSRNPVVVRPCKKATCCVHFSALDGVGSVLLSL